MSAIESLIVRLAQTRVMRHLRATEEGIEDVESHWRGLPAIDRQAFLDQMHAPARPELQAPDRFGTPDTRPLRDLPPGLQAVYKAVQQNVGERKYAALRAKVGGDTRAPGYMASGRGAPGYMASGEGAPGYMATDEAPGFMARPASISNRMEMDEDDDPDWRNTAYAAADEAAGLMGVAGTQVGDRLAELRAVIDGGTSSEVADVIDEARSTLDSSDLDDLLRGEAEYAIRMAGNYLAARRATFGD